MTIYIEKMLWTGILIETSISESKELKRRLNNYKWKKKEFRLKFAKMPKYELTDLNKNFSKLADYPQVDFKQGNLCLSPNLAIFCQIRFAFFW